MPVNSRPFFTVIISTYNRAHLITRALKSLINQTEQDFEAIIIDDGSTDDTKKIINSFVKNFPELHYHKINHTGAESARNKGIALSKGNYITFLDSDDEYKNNHLAHRKQILLSNQNADLLHGGVEIIGSAFVPDKNNPSQQIHLSDCVIGGTFFIKRELMNQLKSFKNITLGSDADFFERAKKAGAAILKTEYPSYIYHREHTETITQQKHY